MPLAPSIELTAATSQVRIVDPLTDPLFARLATAFPDATPFHGAPWAHTLVRAYGHRPFYQLVDMDKAVDRGSRIEGGQHSSFDRRSSSLEPTALLPLMEVSSWLTGRRAVALPFSDFTPLLGTAASSIADRTRYLESIWPQIFKLGRQRGWRTIELRGGPAPVPDAEPSISFHGHVMELGRDESDLFNGLHPSVRRAIRKAQQAGLRVESSHTLDALHDYYALHSRTRQRHGLPPQPFKFFLHLYDKMIASGNAFIVLARLGLCAIAGAVFFHAGRTAVYKYGASDPAHQSLRPNDLLFWETICRLASDGFATLHFGRTDLDHEGLRRFKLGWGTREEPIHYYQFNLRANAFVPAHDRASTRYATLFSRLPLAVNRILGRLAYRHPD